MIRPRLSPPCLSLLLHQSSRGMKKFMRIESGEMFKKEPIFDYENKSKLGGKTVKSVYSWGMNVTGALGHGPYPEEETKSDFLPVSSSPRKVRHKDLADGKKRANTVSAGRGFSLFLMQDGTVYGCGLNSSAQLGAQGNMNIILRPMMLPLPNKIAKIASGREHCLFLDANDPRIVYSTGNNSFGQCGRPILNNEVFFKTSHVHIINFPENIIDMKCGQDHSLFLTETGTVYSCGVGSDGQTGHGSVHSSGEVRQVKGDIEGETITMISTYADTNLAVSSKGDLFGWGNNEYKQLGPDIEGPQLLSPKRLLFTSLPSKTINSIAVGGTACSILDEDGDMYIWGFGILGFGPNVNHCSVPRLMPPPIFGRNDFNPDHRLSKICVGLRHFAAISKEGELFVWGRNRNGCLGLGGHQKPGKDVFADQFSPLKVTLPVRVVDVSLGMDHTMVIARS